MTKTKLYLSNDEKDILQELINVAYGYATSSLSQILDSFATLSIPKINLLDMESLNLFLSEKNNSSQTYYLCSQKTKGAITGKSLFVIDTNSSQNIFEIIKTNISKKEQTINDTLLEITNILSSSTMSLFADSLDIAVEFEPPKIRLINSYKDITKEFDSQTHQIIVISVLIVFDSIEINGELLIIATDDSIITIKEKVNTIIEQYC